jgi:hypothetical protein
VQPDGLDVAAVERPADRRELYLVPNGRPPDEIEVTRELYERAGANRELLMDLGPGWLGLRGRAGQPERPAG